MTSTLQQEAGRKLNFSAQRAMQVAQRLYEQGYITYMRTDSTTLSDEALTAARTQAREMYGDAYVPDAPRRYERKVKNAQEAHEAIRPAGETFRTPDQVARELSGDDLRLYDMVWKRTVASQMNDATGHERPDPAHGHGAVGDGRRGRRRSSRPAAGSSPSPGSCMAYRRARTNPRPSGPTATSCCRRWPWGTPSTGSAFDAGLAHHPAAGPLHRGVAGQGDGGARRGTTLAPTPASSPRSSTAATSGRRARRWCRASPPSRSWACSSATSPTWSTTGSPRRWRTTSTRSPPGAEEVLPWLTRFYFGRGPAPGDGRGDALGLKASVAAHLAEIDAREINSIPLGEGTDGQQIVARVGRYGPYLQRGEDRAVHPRRPGAGRADDRAGRGDPGRALQRPRARHRPRDRARHRGQGGALRPLRAGGRGDRGWRQATHRLAVLDHGAGDADAGAGPRAPAHPADGRDGPRHRRGRRGPQREVRPVSQDAGPTRAAWRARTSC